MLKEDYLSIQQAKLEKMKKYHASYLFIYERELVEKKDPHLVEKINKKHHRFMKKEQNFEKKMIRVNNSVKKRVWEIDLMRAIIIFGMLIDHFLQDFRIFFPKIFDHDAYWSNSFLVNCYNSIGFYTGSDIRAVIRFIGIMMLAILIGINTHFSRNNWKRFGILFSFGIVVNIFYIVCASKGVLNYSIMNIIMSYALSLLIYCIFESIFKRYKKAWKWICLGVGVFLLVGWGFLRYQVLLGEGAPIDNSFFLVFNGGSSRIEKYECAIGDLSFINWLEIISGLKRFGSEHIGLFPIVGYIFIGAFIGQTVYKNKKSLLRVFDKEGEVTANEKMNRATKGFLFFGHHTAFIYIFHQPVYTIIMWIIVTLCMGIPLAF